MPDQLLTYTEAAARLGVSKRTLHRYIEEGLLTPVRVQLTPRLSVPRITVADVKRVKDGSAA